MLKRAINIWQKMEKTNNLPKEEIEENQEPEPNEIENKVAELEDGLRRALAELENTRRRYEKMLEESREYSVAKFSKDILTVMDNLSLALAHKDDTNVIAGVELTQKELKALFDKYKIEEIAPKAGEKFDYNFHNAISEVESKEYESGNILSVMQVGYKLKDRLLRPAFVAVSKKA
jgi:molecular chaperone GrpE